MLYYGQPNIMKTAIILSGGAMRCSYSAGVIATLARELNFKKPDMIVSASGSVGSMFYYISEQYQALEDIWTKILAGNKDFISLTRMQTMDVDYLIDDVFKKQRPLDIDAVKKSGIDFYVPVRNIKTGTLRYIDREDNLNIFEIMRASKAIPLLYGEKVKLDDGNYIDGFIEIGTDALTLKAIEKGATNIIVVETSLNHSFIVNKLYRLFLNKKIAMGLDSDLKNEGANLKMLKDVTIVTLDFTSNMKLWDTNKEKLMDAFQEGSCDALSTESLTEIIRVGDSN